MNKIMTAFELITKIIALMKLYCLKEFNGYEKQNYRHRHTDRRFPENKSNSIQDIPKRVKR